MQSSSGNTNDTNTKTSVHKCVVEVAALVRSHPTILSCFAVEDHVRYQDSSTHNGGAVQQTLSEIATLSRLVCRLHVGPSESILESLSGFGEDGGTDRLRLRGLEWRVMDKASSIRSLRHLTKRRGHGEGTPKKERHDCDEMQIDDES